MDNVRDAYTTKELVVLLGLTRQGIDLRAKREAWQSRPRKGRGGGNEWLLASMPEKTRLQIVARLAPPQRGSIRASAPLPPNAEARANARTQIVVLYRQWAVGKTRSAHRLRETFAHLWSSNQIPAEAWVKNAVPELCGLSIANWERKISASGTAALGGSYGNRKGQGLLDSNTDMQQVALGQIYISPHIRPARLHEILGNEFPGQKVPGLRSVQTWLRGWKDKHKAFYEELVNPDSYRSKYRISFGDADALIDRFNQRWEMDGTPWDILTSDNQRHNITGLIDVFTRSAKLFTSRTTSARAVASTLRRGLEDFGVPETVGTDNGADYTASHITRIMVDLDIYQDICPPFSPWLKPFIERFFRTFSHDLLELVDGYIGHNVAERQAIRERETFAKRLFDKESEVKSLCLAMDSDQLQQFLDDWLLRYHHKPHSGLGGQTPWEARQECIKSQQIRRIDSERALDILLLPMAPGKAGFRTVSKKGVRAGGDGYYQATELALYIGQELQVRFDGDNLGWAYLFDGNGKFVCQAYNSELDGISPEAIQEAQRIQRAANRAQRDALKLAAKATNAADLPKRLLAANVERARRIEAQAAAESIITHASPAIQEAVKASRAGQGAAATISAEQQSKAQEQARKVLTNTKKWEVPKSDADRWEEYGRLKNALQVGKEVPFEARNWILAWEHSPACKTFIMMARADEKRKAEQAVQGGAR